MPSFAAPDGSPPPPPPAPEILVRLPPGRLLLAGITGPEVIAVLAAIAFGFDTLADLGVDPDQVDGVALSRLAVVGLLALAVPVWFATAGLIGMIRRWDLTATIAGDELRVTYGLLRKNEFVVNTGRVQDVRIAHRLLLRPFGRADVRVRTAASGRGDQSRVDIPLPRRDRDRPGPGTGPPDRHPGPRRSALHRRRLGSGPWSGRPWPAVCWP